MLEVPYTTAEADSDSGGRDIISLVCVKNPKTGESADLFLTVRLTAPLVMAGGLSPEHFEETNNFAWEEFAKYILFFYDNGYTEIV